MKAQIGPLVTFFLIAFGVPWVAWSVLWVMGDDLSVLERRLLHYFAVFCSIGGIVSIYLEGGKAGLRDLWRRCIRVSAPAVWWLVAIFVPLIVGLFALWAWQINPWRLVCVSWIPPSCNPDHAIERRTISAAVAATPFLVAFIVGPLFEEVGWRGYLLPRLLRTLSPLTASLVIGLLWSIWHAPLYAGHIFSEPSSAIVFTVNTLCYSIIMTALYKNSRSSVLIAGFAFHYFINIFPTLVFNAYEGLWWPLAAREVTLGYCIVTVILLSYLGKNLERKG